MNHFYPIHKGESYAPVGAIKKVGDNKLTEKGDAIKLVLLQPLEAQDGRRK